MTKFSLDEADTLARTWVRLHTNPLVLGDLETHERVMELARAGGIQFAHFLTTARDCIDEPSEVSSLAAGPFEEFLHNCPTASDDLRANILPHGILVELLSHVSDLADVSRSVRSQIEKN